MTDVEKLCIKRALQLLCKVAVGITEKNLLDQVEIGIGRPISTVDRKILIAMMLDKEWIYSYRDPITDELKFAIEAEGKRALVAL
jgi:hypothetical protein